MTLRDIVDIWEMKHNGNFFDEITLHQLVDKDALVNYLMMEYQDMITIDSDSGMFHFRVVNFFKTHKWNIDKLAESLNFYYNPIGNVNYHLHNKWARDESIARDEDIDSEKVEDDDWTETGHTDETDTNYVSAFNDVESREHNIVDSEHHRDVIDIDYNKQGTDDKTTMYHETQDEDTVEDEDYDGTVDKWGHDSPNSFQELIEEERQQAQFNIYKWIGKHFCLELLVSIW